MYALQHWQLQSASTGLRSARPGFALIRKHSSLQGTRGRERTIQAHEGTKLPRNDMLSSSSSPVVALIYRVAELEVPFVHERHPEARGARGIHAVVHVGAEGGAEDHVERVADAHHVARLPGRQRCGNQSGPNGWIEG